MDMSVSASEEMLTRNSYPDADPGATFLKYRLVINVSEVYLVLFLVIHSFNVSGKNIDLTIFR